MRTREATVRRFAFTDMVFRAATRASAILVLVLLGGVAISLIAGSWEALSKFGISFLSTESWNPVTENFGALAPIYGTIVTSAIAIIIAVPIGIGIAVFLTELC
ncbi:MAG: phosphate ABC transporter permease subunit PstC, partial [Mesorhizobium sp.]